MARKKKKGNPGVLEDVVGVKAPSKWAAERKKQRRAVARGDVRRVLLGKKGSFWRR